MWSTLLSIDKNDGQKKKQNEIDWILWFGLCKLIWFLCFVFNSLNVEMMKMTLSNFDMNKSTLRSRCVAFQFSFSCFFLSFEKRLSQTKRMKIGQMYAWLMFHLYFVFVIIPMIVHSTMARRTRNSGVHWRFECPKNVIFQLFILLAFRCSVKTVCFERFNSYA